jgi:hypothetical protein
MPRVLVVSPHFPPVNAPDMHRARLVLPHMRALGWEPVVLAVTPGLVEGAVLDPVLEETYPADIRVVRVGGMPHRFTRALGFGSLWWRCGGALRRAGERLLSAEKFDLIFFSTTQFDAFGLGPRWLARFGVPYVLDYQDPWVNDYYYRTNTPPPGGSFKFGLSQFTARRREPAAVRSAAAIVSVSQSYGPDLLRRYPELDPHRVHHLPFGATTTDFEIARGHVPAKPLIPFGDGRIHFVYAGRCGPDMSHSLSLLFQAYHRYMESHPREAQKMHFHFIGTDYAPPPLGRYWALPIARQEKVEANVSEHCYRVPYFDALHYLVRADALIAVGSNDPTYSASKIFPYLIARRPLLTIVHEDSIMLKLSLGQGVATSYGFSNEGVSQNDLVNRIHQEWFVDGGHRLPPPGDPEQLQEFTSIGMTHRLTSVFEQAKNASER